MAKNVNRYSPLHQHTVLTLEPPLLLLHRLPRALVKHDIDEKPLNLRDEQRQVADARRLDEVALQPAVAVRGQLLRVHADFERDGPLPYQSAEQCRRRGCRERRRGMFVFAVAGHRG